MMANTRILIKDKFKILMIQIIIRSKLMIYNPNNVYINLGTCLSALINLKN